MPENQTMIERVARAAFERAIEGIPRPVPHARPDVTTWGDLEPEVRQHWRAVAGAALFAMREPTSRVIEAGSENVSLSFDFDGSRDSDETIAVSTFHAMINAALAEAP